MTSVHEPAVTVGGEPSRYRYASAQRSELTRPPDQAVELRLRSTTGVHSGPISQDARNGIDGLRLELARSADFTPLSGLRHLRWLAVDCPVPIDLDALASAVAAAPGLRRLSIKAPVTDIAPLAALTTLQDLALEHTRVVDLTPLAGMPHLDDLSVCDGPLSDLSPLRHLRLGRLFVYRTRVTDLSPLAGMPTLQVLGLVGCPVRDLSVVTTLPALHHVNLRRTTVTDLRDLPTRAPRVTFEGFGEAPAGTPDRPAVDDSRDPAALLAAFQATDDFQQRWDLAPTLIASRDPAAVQEAVRFLLGDQNVTLAGLFLQGGAGDTPFAANPWGIPAEAGLSQALTHVWAPVADAAPGFVTTLHERTLGLALLTSGTSSPRLGYLLWHRGEDATEPVTLDDLGARDDDLSIVVATGTAPRDSDPDAVVPVLAGPVPRPVRDLWKVHHTLYGNGGHVGGDVRVNTLGYFDRDGWDAVAERIAGLPPDRFVHGVGGGGGDFDSFLLDLDVLDAAGHPTVAQWAYKEWTVGDHRQFWDWFEIDGARAVFGA